MGEFTGSPESGGARAFILITGANGQLGMELRELSSLYPQFDFIFLSRQELDIANAGAVSRLLEKNQPRYCINCAAYTAVDKAESEKEEAFKINAEAVGKLAAACNEQNTILLHISTDYVFNGKAGVPYKEDSDTDPVNIYGASKLEGERLALKNNPRTIIIRSSWVYSSYGKNFVKTMLRLMNEKKEINVVNDQYGSPTHAADLAEAILQIIAQISTQPFSYRAHAGVYHFTNEGEISWYDFAITIKELSGSSCKVRPVSSSEYPTPAKRPAYAVLDKSKIQEIFKIELKGWKDSLGNCIQKLR